MILKILYWGARLNFMFSLPQLYTKSLCVLAIQNSQFEASTSSRPQTVNFEALGHKAIVGARCVCVSVGKGRHNDTVRSLVVCFTCCLRYRKMKGVRWSHLYLRVSPVGENGVKLQLPAGAGSWFGRSGYARAVVMSSSAEVRLTLTIYLHCADRRGRQICLRMGLEQRWDLII